MSENTDQSTLEEECRHFSGIFHDLCSGVGTEGRRNPSPKSVNKFREFVGLAPLDLPENYGSLSSAPVNSGFQVKLIQDKQKFSETGLLARGPGTKLKEIFESLGVKQSESCSCRAIEMEMNRLGVEGCEREAERLIDMIEQNAKRLSWWEKIKVGASGLAQGYMFNLSARGLFQEALRRAAEEAGPSTGR